MTRLLPALGLLRLVGTGEWVTPQADTADLRLRSAILRAEDARPRSAEGLAPILAGLSSPDVVTRRLAVRALGRLEREDLMERIAAALRDSAPHVRAEAANAMAQSASHGGAQTAWRLFTERLSAETDPDVRGAVFRSVGRLRLMDPEESSAVERVLVQGASGPGLTESVLAGATHGFVSLYRRAGTRRPPSLAAIERLVELTLPPHPVVVRRQALAALLASGQADSGALLDALRDPDWQVRRLAVVAARTQEVLPGRERIIRRAWSDSAWPVRHEAIQAYGRRQLARDGCEPVVRGLDDPSPHVRLAVIDLLAQCGAGSALTLRALAREPLDDQTWHSPARALVALAQALPQMADSLVPGFAAQPVWWARMYAARAAHATGNVAVLEQLARDPSPNVQQAAVIGLHGLRGHSADPLFIKALESNDYQLLLTAAQALDSSPAANQAVPPLLRALRRVTAERRETSRDPRSAILHTLGTIAGPDQTGALRPYLADFDPAIAAQAAELLARWTGAPHTASPRPMPAPPAPTWEELERLATLRPVILMRRGGRIVLRLWPFDAPTNTARFVRMARERRFDGLTFHRVVPNFVVQGGSPGANEYMGDGPYTRDELGLVSHLRGTVGVSTRGRDTGDGQLFINLVDNIRLDHDYTLFAEVIEGMEVVDAMLEGAVIERVVLEAGGHR